MSIITLDDRDKAIVYSAGWARGGSTNEFDKTTTWTAVAGSTAKVTFNGAIVHSLTSFVQCLVVVFSH